MLTITRYSSLGSLSYTTFLQREGFPEVEVPVVVINVQNFTNDLEKNNKELTIPIEQALKEVSIMESFQSTTTPVGSFIIANVSPEFSSDDALKIIKDEISEQVTLPETSKIDYQTFRAGSIDGTHDLLFSITNDSKSIVEMQNDAQIVASELASLNEVREANVIEQITKEVDSSGNEFFYQSQFQRVGLKNSDGSIEFKNAVNIGVVKRNQNVGTIELSEAVRGKVNDLVEDGVLSGYEINYGGDFAEPLKSQISSLEQNALSGLIAVIIISFIFISWRSSLITGLFIPVVMASTFMALFVMGYSLNIISLFALILVLGLLVDDVIIVVEAIAKKREEGLERKEAIKEAIKDIGPADISGTITTILVFMPMLFISGILGDFIVLIPVTVIMTLIFSLLIALSLFPMLSSWVLPKGDVSQKKFGKVLNFSSRFINKLGVYVSKYTNWYLNSKIKTTVVAILGIVLVGVGMNFAGRLDFNIFPKAKDSDSIFVNITYLPGTDIEKAKSIATDVENIILNNLDQSNIEYLTYYIADDTQANSS
ncbi:MAG: hypothetical protein KatS3mg085_635 [Candidatus Dojkabacteria bacterium]|nr:MAG: hypothetical protein KatS3mg085_635 [Candidatus Dojkabacteria bacterium]